MQFHKFSSATDDAEGAAPPNRAHRGGESLPPPPALFLIGDPMPISTTRVIAEKKRLARSLLALAARWRDPAYMNFVDSDRRAARVLTLTLRARQLEQDVKRAIRNKRHGVDNVAELGAF